MEQALNKKVLVVGAGGFTGGFIVDEALRRGCQVWAGVRESTSRQWLGDPRIHFLTFDFDDPAAVREVLASALPEGERWDWIVYNLGATKVNSYADFNRINYEYLRTFTNALDATGLIPEKFLYMSSLSSIGVGDEKRYTPFTEGMVPQPNTRYGASKLKSEVWLMERALPYIIFRPTGVYGPRDHDYFLMFESIAKGVDFGAGYRRQLLSFIYVEDLARAVFDALERSEVKEVYNLAEPRGYSQKEFRRMVARSLGKRVVLPIRVPLWGLKGVSFVAEKIGVARMKPSTLNRDKYKIMKQRNWGVDTAKARNGFGFAPQVPLSEGVERCVAWYRQHGWLKK